MQQSQTVPRPTGTVTFLFTDIVGSTRLWEQDPVRMESALAWHDDLISSMAPRFGGYAFNHSGDSWAIAFADPLAAARCALELHEDLDAQPSEAIRLSVRLKIDTAVVRDRDGDYFGSALSRAARALEHTRGGEVLMTGPAAGLVRHGLDPSLSLVDLGEFKLRGLRGWEHLFRLEPGRHRRTGWRLRVQHGAWIALLFTVFAIVWMAVAWPPSSTDDPAPGAEIAPTPGTERPEAEPSAEIAWTTATGFGEPLVKDGRVYAGGPEGSLIAMDLRTGREIWTVDLPGQVTGRPATGSGNVFVVNAPIGRLTAVTKSDGSLVFSCATGSSIVSPPAAGTGRAFVVTSETPQIWAYEARPAFAERCQVDGMETAIKAFGDVPVPPVMYGHTLLVVDTAGIVHAFDGNSLSRGSIWSFDVPHESGTDFATYSEVEVTQPSVLEISPPSRGGTGADRPLVVIGERRIRNSAEGWRMLGIDLHSGESSLAPITVGGPPAVGLGRIWVSNPERTELMVLDSTGAPEHRLAIPMSLLPPLIDVDADRVYLVSPDDTITAINGVELTVEWTYPYPEGIVDMASGRGILLVQEDSGRITALRKED
jgi:class 3 adenylate cyclase/outer membrane protein assembly factor BamB